MTKVVAVHQISWNPTRERVYTGDFDDNGNPVVRSKSTVIMPGSSFEIDDPAELAYMLKSGAVREPNDADELLETLAARAIDNAKRGSASND